MPTVVSVYKCQATDWPLLSEHKEHGPCSTQCYQLEGWRLEGIHTTVVVLVLLPVYLLDVPALVC